MNNNNQSEQPILTTVSSLVQHDMPVEAVDGSKKFRAILGPNIGNEKAPNHLPLLFSIGTDNVLYFLTIQDGASSNWSSYDLTSVLGSGMQVTTFEVTQDPQTNQFVLFLAVTDGKGSSHFYKTSVLTTAFDGKVDVSFWSELTILPDIANSVINTISASNHTVILTTKREGTSTPAKYYCFNLDDNSCSECALPDHATEIYKVAAGQYSKPGAHITLAGYFIFYNTGDPAVPVKEVIFQPRAGSLITNAIEYHFPTGFGNTINDIFVLPAKAADQPSILYASGDQGVVECPSYNTWNVIIAPTAGMSYKQIVVAATGNNTSVFLVQESDTQLKFLSQTTNYFIDDKSWSPPVVVATDIVEFDTILALGSTNNQILAVTNTNTLQHLIQDAATGAWAASPILVANPGKSYSVSGFAAFVTLNVPEGTSSVGQPLFIKADIDATILVNNASYRVGPTTTAEIILQSDNLYIEYLADALDCPILFVTSPLFTAGNKAAIDLEAGLYNDLRKLNSAKALKAAGNELIPDVGSYSDDFLNNFANVLQSLIKLRSNLIAQALEKAFASSPSNETLIQATPKGDLFSLIVYLGRQAVSTLLESAFFSTLGFCMLTASVEIALIYFTPDPNAIKLSLEVGDGGGTFRIESHAKNRQLKIDNPQAARKATKYLFRTVNSNDENTKKKYKKEYSCNIVIGPPNISSLLPSSYQLNDRNCAIGAEICIKAELQVNGQPREIVISDWYIYGNQIDLNKGFLQLTTLEVGGPVPTLLLRKLGGYEGNSACTNVAWITEGDNEVFVFVAAKEDGIISWFKSNSHIFTVHAPKVEAIDFNMDKPKITEEKNNQGQLIGWNTEMKFDMINARASIPVIIGPAGWNIFIGGTIGSLQVLRGFYTTADANPKNSPNPKYSGSNEIYLDLNPESTNPDSIFYTEKPIGSQLVYTIFFNDSPKFLLPIPKNDNDIFSKRSAHHIFDVYAAFKAPINPQIGVMDSYTIVTQGCSWGWIAASQIISGDGYDCIQDQHPNNPRLYPTRIINDELHELTWFLPPQWISNSQMILKEEHNGIPEDNLPYQLNSINNEN